MIKRMLTSRAFRQGSVATAVTVIVVALIIVFNMVVTALADRYGLSLDLTSEKAFALSEDSKTFLKALDKDIVIYVLMPEKDFVAGGEYYMQANEVIKKYEQQSGRVKAEYVDLVRNPNFAARFPDLQLAATTILVTCGDKTTELTPYELYNIEQDPYYGQAMITSSKAEQAMTSAMLNVTSDKKLGAVIISGHNEAPIEGLKNLLDMNNFTVAEQNLLTEELDPEAKIAVMNAPTRDLTDEELKKLDVFLENGGKKGKTLLYFASIEQPAMPKLAVFLADWGIKVNDGAVFESSGNRVLNMNMLMPVVDYTEEVYAKPLKERNLYTIVPYSKPLEVLFETKGSFTVSSPLEFSQTSGIVPMDAPGDWQPKQTDLVGPLPALIVSQNLAYEGTTPLRSNVAVCGSTTAISDSYLAAPSIGNSDYFISLINTLCEREDVLSIQAKTIGGNELGVEAQTHIIGLGFVLVILLPLAVLVTGIVIWMRRRHR